MLSWAGRMLQNLVTTKVFLQGFPTFSLSLLQWDIYIDAVVYPDPLDVKNWPCGFSQFPARTGG